MTQSGNSKFVLVVFLAAVAVIAVIGVLQFPEEKQDASSQPVTGNAVESSGDLRTDDKPDEQHSPVKTVGYTTNDSPEITVDLSETSWDDPFAAKYWAKCESSKKRPLALWSFDEKSMWCASQQTAGATFRRPYRKFSLELQLERPQPTGAFEVRLSSQASQTLLSAEFADARVDVIAWEPMKKPAVLKTSDLTLSLSTEKTVLLRVAATGNRIIISHNHRRILTCRQPAGLSGRKLEISLLSHGSFCRITRLRIDGE